MRKLFTKDLFAAMRVVKNADLRAELGKITELAQSEKPLEEIGLAGFVIAAEALAEKRAEQAVYDFLAGPLETEPEKVSDMSLEELWDALATIGKENDLPGFFGRLSALISTR